MGWAVVGNVPLAATFKNAAMVVFQIVAAFYIVNDHAAVSERPQG